MIDFDIKMFFTALKSSTSITSLCTMFNREVADAQANISKNIDLARKIVGEETTQQDPTDFFQTVTIFEFSGISALN